jgi:hypothetical protein
MVDAVLPIAIANRTRGGGMTDEPESDGGATLDVEAGEAMHLHRPKPLHGWREVLLEIGVIVVGIVIAVGLEQTVEFFHHRHQRQQLEAALQTDGKLNRRYIEDDIATAQGVLDWALGQAAACERAGPAGPLTLRRMPPAFIGSLDAGAWPSAKASGVTNLLPASAQNWLEYLDGQNSEIFVSSASATGRFELGYGALDQALIGHVTRTSSGDIDVSTLTAAQRSMVTERLYAVAELARGVMRRLVIYEAANEFILSTPLDKLDTPEAAKRYSQIYKTVRQAHPASEFALQ